MTGGRARGLVLACVVVAPVAVGVVYAAAGALGVAGPGAFGLTMTHIDRVVADPATWLSLGWTVATGAAATALAVLGAIATAVLFRGATPVDRLARAAALAPLPIPYVVAATGGVLLLGQSGLLSRIGAAIGLFHGPADFPVMVLDRPGVGFVLTFGWKEFPFLALFAISILATRGHALEDTARTLGAGPWDTFARVTLPVLWRGLAPVVIATFLFVSGSYEAAALLGPSNPLPLPVATFERYNDLDLARRGDAFVLTLAGLMLALMAVMLFEWARSRADSLDG